MSTSAVTEEAMIARRSRVGGYAPGKSRRLLSELKAAHDGVNLASALVWWGFATERQALRFAGVESLLEVS
jgi:hypothetical protein